MATPLFYLFSLQLIFWITTTVGLKIVQPQLEPISDSNWGNKDHSKPDKHPYSSLDLKEQEHFLWGSPSVYGSSFANMTMFTGDNELFISMERFSHMLKSVNCGKTMKLTFKSNETFQYAIHAWNWTNEEEKNSFIMIANYKGCGKEGFRQPYCVHHVDYDMGNFTAYLYANKTTWKKAAHTFHLDFGQIGGSNSLFYSNSTMSQPLNNLTSKPSTISHRATYEKQVGIDLTQNWNKGLFRTTIDGIQVGLSCIDCGITGKIEITGHIEYSAAAVYVFTIDAQPKNVGMHMDLKLTAEGKLIGNWVWNKNLLTLPLLGGFDIPGILKLGPNLDIDAGFAASALNGSAIIRGGSKASISDNSIAKIDMLAVMLGDVEDFVEKFSGWSPSITPIPLDITAEVEAEANAYLQFSLQLSFDLFNVGANVAVQFKAPSLQIAARLMYDNNGVCADKKKTIGVDIDGDIGFVVDIRGWDQKSKNAANTLFEVPLWNNSAAYSFTPRCFGFGPATEERTYIIFPKDGSNSVANANFEKRLQGLSQLNSISDIPLGNIVSFWTANLTTYNAAKVQEDSYVENCFPDELLDVGWESPKTDNLPPRDTQFNLSNASLNKSTTEHRPRWNPFEPLIIQQTNAPPELKIVSQPMGVDRQDLKSYDYIRKAGRDITLYVLDSGANLKNPYLKGMPGKLRWIFTNDFDKREIDEANHGTCVLSKAVSPMFGTAKNPDIVIVRMASMKILGADEHIRRMITEREFLAGLVKILDDVKSRELQGKAVVNLSMGFSKRENPNQLDFIERLEEYLKLLVAEDVVIVVASGNNRLSNDRLSSYPARFQTFLPLVVVGATEISGMRAYYSQGVAVELASSAVGEVECPSNQGEGLQRMEGTSVAAPQVAGVAALILSDPEIYGYKHVEGYVAKDIKSIIKKLSYPRLPDEPMVIWNGVDNYECCGCLGRRDNNSSQCSTNSTSMTTTTTSTTSTTTTVVEPTSSPTCNPAYNFNYTYTGGTNSDGPGQTNVGWAINDYPSSGLGDCCALCYNTTGCFVWTYNSTYSSSCGIWVTKIWPNNGGSSTVSTNACPLGWFVWTDVTYTVAGATWGVGPCSNITSFSN